MRPAATDIRSISVVIPVYNSAGTIDRLLSRLTPILDHAASVHEVILVNDGSRDACWERIAALIA
jgi:glycosyltransferase involved in cell wall biosynthesis